MSVVRDCLILGTLWTCETDLFQFKYCDIVSLLLIRGYIFVQGKSYII